MVYVKILKNKAYNSRMQTKPKRRREGKTDYYARRRLVFQEKNKYDSKRYRLVVRRTLTRILTQIIYSNMNGDVVLCAAESQELKNYGLTAGLTNYSAAYATGLLLARRLLKQVGLSELYKPNEKVNGEYFNVEEDVKDKRPFKALLDVGITRTTTGNRVFGALKGACDGGINVPHKTKIFPGYTRAKTDIITNKKGKAIDSEKSEAKYDAKKHQARIYGGHVTVYMNHLKKEDPAKYKIQFSQWDKTLAENKVKTPEDLYKKVHAAIIANPDRVKKAGNKNPTKKVVTAGPARVYQNSKNKKWLRHFKITGAEKKVKVQAKFAEAMKGAQ